MKRESFSYAESSRAQCPRCENMAEVHLRRNTGRRLEYAGACQTTLDGGVTCGTVIALVATAHLFPSPRG